MQESLFVTLIFNISLLVLVATILTEFAPLRRLFQSHQTLRDQLLLAVVFGTMAILSTYGGMEMLDAIVNTRVVSVAAAGLIGGPVAGVGAGLIGGTTATSMPPIASLRWPVAWAPSPLVSLAVWHIINSEAPFRNAGCWWRSLWWVSWYS